MRLCAHSMGGQVGGVRRHRALPVGRASGGAAGAVLAAELAAETNRRILVRGEPQQKQGERSKDDDRSQGGGAAAAEVDAETGERGVGGRTAPTGLVGLDSAVGFKL